MIATASREASDRASRDGERPDGQLMAAIARGDADAFGVVVDRYSNSLYRLAWRFTGREGEAQDVVQDVFAKVWANAGAWRPGPGSGLGAWLRRVATNLCLDRLRRRRFISDAPVPEIADHAPGADEDLNRRRLAALAAKAVAKLPERQRAAIILTYYEELSNAAAADTLAMNIKAFESLLLRARATLRQFVVEAGLSAADLGAAG